MASGSQFVALKPSAHGITVLNLLMKPIRYCSSAQLPFSQVLHRAFAEFATQLGEANGEESFTLRRDVKIRVKTRLLQKCCAMVQGMFMSTTLICIYLLNRSKFQLLEFQCNVVGYDSWRDLSVRLTFAQKCEGEAALICTRS